ncbi:hypothetical protein BJ508DRAFT_307823 [Ascobolus immersus RN42]|uniref:Uncharacterized protein n=1 Tax=Ascobolus immersus RN42 TaxID=1160509 RepID=A0A3N4I1Q5_ASCIM|nr:hypothetical protein BJ508DRAFT_307823 [Ascobolus immersus RN42]
MAIDRTSEKSDLRSHWSKGEAGEAESEKVIEKRIKMTNEKPKSVKQSVEKPESRGGQNRKAGSDEEARIERPCGGTKIERASEKLELVGIERAESQDREGRKCESRWRARRWNLSIETVSQEVRIETTKREARGKPESRRWGEREGGVEGMSKKLESRRVGRNREGDSRIEGVSQLRSRIREGRGIERGPELDEKPESRGKARNREAEERNWDGKREGGSDRIEEAIELRKRVRGRNRRGYRIERASKKPKLRGPWVRGGFKRCGC